MSDDEMRRLSDENARLREVLAYYATPSHYDGGEVPGHIYILDEDGRSAREALGLPRILAPSERFEIEMKCRKLMGEGREVQW